MNKLYYLLLIMLTVTAVCSAQSQLLPDLKTRQQTENDLKWKEKQLPNGHLFSILERKDLTNDEHDALSFLYAYMPESDIVDKTGDYFLNNVRLTLQACQEMPWGKILNPTLIRHFILPMRVNNEPLDNFRATYYQELKSRVEHLSLKEAILAINHWCHEKVIYKPTDGRTSSPLQTIRTAYGRCGEESTFLVTALRTVGIPARQVYTPRWAHTDDNHAWVEAWADGKWHFLGACEPEPVLDLGWFNAPASRGMLMHTKVFGHYEGSEEIMARTPNYTEINVISNYASSANTQVQVVDSKGQPVKSAKVEFKLYNYAEFYTVATKYTDENGNTSLTSGLGDMLVWASANGQFGYRKISAGKDQAVILTINRTVGTELTEDIDIVPPAEHCILPGVSPSQRANNTCQMELEDSIRNLYTATMLTHKGAITWAEELKLDTFKTASFLERSCGNYPVIQNFLLSAKNKLQAIKLLSSLTSKDLRDIPINVLTDHNTCTKNSRNVSDKIYVSYILCPRVELEALTPYKKYFQTCLHSSFSTSWKNDPKQFIEWIKKNIIINNELNNNSIPISPEGVWKARVSDKRSRAIFFVSVCRSIGIPAQVDPVTGKTLYYQNARWNEVKFEEEQSTESKQGILQACYADEIGINNPKYYTHFTISKFENGTLKLLSYDEGDADLGGGADYQNLLAKGLKLDMGYYLLVTGNRQPDGSVLSHLCFFNIRQEASTDIRLLLRKKLSEKAESIEISPKLQSALSATVPNGTCLIALLGVNQEPTNHVLRDLSALKKEFKDWGETIIFIYPDKIQAKKFHKKDFPDLPTTTVSLIDDANHSLQQELIQNGSLKNKEQLPMLVLLKDSKVVFSSQGYTIGIGEQIMKALK